MDSLPAYTKTVALECPVSPQSREILNLEPMHNVDSFKNCDMDVIILNSRYQGHVVVAVV